MSNFEKDFCAALDEKVQVVDHDAIFRDSGIPKGDPWVLRTIADGSWEVRLGTEVVCFAVADPPCIRATLRAEYTSTPSSDVEKAWLGEHVRDEMFTAWAARGYAEDGGGWPDNGYDDEDGLYRLNVVKEVASLDALAEEVKWAADQEMAESWDLQDED